MPVQNEHDERFVYVRSSSGVEGYVQLKYVVRAACAGSSEEQNAIVSHSSGGKSAMSATASAPGAQSGTSTSAPGNGHPGEWRAVNERPARRYSAAGQRMGDINKYALFGVSHGLLFF